MTLEEMKLLMVECHIEGAKENIEKLPKDFWKVYESLLTCSEDKLDLTTKIYGKDVDILVTMSALGTMTNKVTSSFVPQVKKLNGLNEHNHLHFKYIRDGQVVKLRDR